MAQTHDFTKLATQFLQQDYHDRGMVKWQGFYLSDHTEDVTRYTIQKDKRMHETLKEYQTEAEIGSLLKKAFDDQSMVTIQLAQKNEYGEVPPTISGKIEGFTERNEIIINKAKIGISLINCCIPHRDWSMSLGLKSTGEI